MNLNHVCLILKPVISYYTTHHPFKLFTVKLCNYLVSGLLLPLPSMQVQEEESYSLLYLKCLDQYMTYIWHLLTFVELM